jgi:hypothetical protein
MEAKELNGVGRREARHFQLILPKGYRDTLQWHGLAAHRWHRSGIKSA